MKIGFPETSQFRTDQISLCDPTTFDLAVLKGSRQTTDAYLAGLAFHKWGRQATLDSSIPWREVRGADSGLIEKIG